MNERKYHEKRKFYYDKTSFAREDSCVYKYFWYGKNIIAITKIEDRKDYLAIKE